MTKEKLFLELAKPNEIGISRWVTADEFIGEFSELKLGNGGSWCRKESSLAKKYIVEFEKNKNKIIAVRLNGFNVDISNQNINSTIKKIIMAKKCVILGTSKPEVDHKNGRKDDSRVYNTQRQKESDFQPLSKAANDAKRQYCKDCKKNNLRYDAKLLGYPMSFYKGDINYDEKLGCEGCFWHDPIKFRQHLIIKK